MGNFHSGAHARLIFPGGASRAACLLNSDFGHIIADAVPLATVAGTHRPSFARRTTKGGRA